LQPLLIARASAFDSLEDAQEDAISKKVDAVLHGDLDEWSKWLKQFPDLNLESLCIDYRTLFELFQRRHVILHNGGRVSRLYLRRMERFGNREPLVNTPLPVDDVYLERAFDELEALGALLVAGVWSKAWPKEEPAAIHSLYLRSYDLLLAGRWIAVEKICSIGKKLKSSDEASRHIFQVNEWVAQKRLRGIDAVLDQVRAWDTSALSLRFTFVQAALADDLDRAFDIVDQLLAAQELELDDLLEWPVLEEMRADERFAALVKRTASAQGDSGATASAIIVSPGLAEPSRRTLPELEPGDASEQGAQD
jgi:hypothetical protein